MYRLRVYFYNLKRLLKNYRGPVMLKMFFLYTALTIKCLLQGLAPWLKISSEKIFGFKVSFFTYRDFIGLFEEIFIGREYYFETKSAAPLIVDCGSNIGMSVIYFKWLYPDAVITAIEADPGTFAMLKKNIEDNKFSGISLFNNAAHDRITTVKFYYDPATAGNLRMSMNAGRQDGKSFNTVKTVLLSSLIKANTDFVKMDIEGAEGAVMAELVKKGCLKRVSKLAMEVHHNMEGSREILSGILAAFTKNGFKFQLYAPNNPPYFVRKFQDVMVYAEKEAK